MTTIGWFIIGMTIGFVLGMLVAYLLPLEMEDDN